MTSQGTHKVRELDRQDINALLARNLVGRLAFGSGDRIEVQPIGFVFHDGWIYGRTSPGMKLQSLTEVGDQVAFEVDEIESMLHWRSVIIRGDFEIMAPDTAGETEWDHTVKLLRRVIPDTFTHNDPVADRSVVFRIRVQEATGRAME